MDNQLILNIKIDHGKNQRANIILQNHSEDRAMLGSNLSADVAG
jgi:hypothetical protein